MKLEKYVACICEGNSEQAIVDLLLDGNKLIFTREDMLEKEVIRCRSAKTFETRYLRKGFQSQITVLRILDSRAENFKLSKPYEHKIKVINVITAPEIEMLVILKENLFERFKRSKMKPSEYCKAELGYRNVKSYDWVKDYFSDIGSLVSAIHEYHRISKLPKNEYSLNDLLR